MSDTTDAPAEPALLTEPAAELPTRHYLVLDQDGVVISAGQSNLLPDGASEVDQATVVAAWAKVGRCKLVAGQLQDYAPAASSEPTGVALQDEISPRQFYQEAAAEGIIAKAEALAFMVSKTLPKVLADPIGQLPEDQQFPVLMALYGTAYSRSNPFTDMIGQLIGKDPAAMDTFWRAAAAR